MIWVVASVAVCSDLMAGRGGRGKRHCFPVNKAKSLRSSEFFFTSKKRFSLHPSHTSCILGHLRADLNLDENILPFLSSYVIWDYYFMITADAQTLIRVNNSCLSGVAGRGAC